jgi:hypothetical protein
MSLIVALLSVTLVGSDAAVPISMTTMNIPWEPCGSEQQQSTCRSAGQADLRVAGALARRAGPTRRSFD